MGKAAVRLSDVARRAGVSTTTASVVLNDKAEGIPEITRQRVLGAASELGYRANSLARSLRLQRSMTLGLISDDIASMPFAGAMVGGAQEAAWEAGYMLVVVDTLRDERRERRAIEELRDRRVDGFLYAAGHHQIIEPPRDLDDTPSVLLDARDTSGRLAGVVPDEAGGASAAVRHLLDAGHRRIGYLQNISDIPASGLRLEGYLRTLRDAGIEPDGSLVEVTVPEDRERAAASAFRLLDRPDRPTALFCFSDRAAAAAYVAARRLGLRIPDDVSIVGFDNLELVAAWVDPGLTTVQLPHAEMGRWGVARLVQMLEDPESAEPVQALMPCPLVERGSVAPPRRA
jgi:LacI family transcriptional regulator